jgi:NAD+ kinase
VAAEGSRELEVLFRVAQAVHAVVRQASTSPHRADVVAMGADGSPTEEVDRVAEAQILATLDEEQVDWDVLSEEAGLVRRGGGKLLVVDPIDGSHNALRGLPFATVSLALGKNDLRGIDLGVVRDLTRGTTYWGSRGEGAFRDGRRLKTRTWDQRSELFFLNLGRHATSRVVGLAARARRVRSLGCASFEMLAVAEGAADAYVFENDTPSRNLRVTDIAAAYRILLESGGNASDVSGASLESFPLALGERTSVFAWGDPVFGEKARPGGYL